MPLGPPGRGPASSCLCGRLQMAPRRCQGLLPWVLEWVCCQSDFIATASQCCIKVNRLKEAQSKENFLAWHVCKMVRVRSRHGASVPFWACPGMLIRQDGDTAWHGHRVVGLLLSATQWRPPPPARATPPGLDCGLVAVVVSGYVPKPRSPLRGSAINPWIGSILLLAVFWLKYAEFSARKASSLCN